MIRAVGWYNGRGSHGWIKAPGHPLKVGKHRGPRGGQPGGRFENGIGQNATRLNQHVGHGSDQTCQNPAQTDYRQRLLAEHLLLSLATEKIKGQGQGRRYRNADYKTGYGPFLAGLQVIIIQAHTQANGECRSNRRRDGA